jgi:hypothetical protein
MAEGRWDQSQRAQNLTWTTIQELSKTSGEINQKQYLHGLDFKKMILVKHSSSCSMDLKFLEIIEVNALFCGRLNLYYTRTIHANYNYISISGCLEKYFLIVSIAA